ncbi:GatB/YqeY domain-containing protein [Cellulomonas xiejunii]|uniref:GatB/YqeY domain-containing protein n=1 Tax=Cellulomonas xiejunii TaxID=2968083 RepID=A0ABY5KPP3_9CELL|nr:GatB/YqeY domain-containing protein [Cellulomonas xiejunii]MCC2313955.1 GatB/YqeY domain-containing protein [Cellulomonas xiejunii]MCC2322401.1 GatB/YqeY domain-containing protein [Cellulomonas xiejunii]UUI72451.1 GatB/YqeY domain-containing protein [Cellulomonas xiejunii]
MSTLDRLTADLTTSLKARDTLRTSTLRQLIGAVRHEEKAGTVARELSEDEILKVLARESKKRRESAQIYADAGAADRAATETAEAQIVDEYLPTRLSDDELAALVDAVVTDTGASSLKDMGTVMKEANARAQGRADGKALSALVRSRLAG